MTPTDNVRNHLLFAMASHEAARKELLISLLGENEDINGISLFDNYGEIFRLRKDASSGAVNYSGIGEDVRLRKVLASLTPDTRLNDFYIRGQDRTNVSMVLPLAGGHIEVLLDLKRLYDRTSNLRMEKNWRRLILDDRRAIVLSSDGWHPAGKDDLWPPSPQSGHVRKDDTEKWGPV